MRRDVRMGRYVKTKGAMKLHLVLDNSSFLPQYAVITDARRET